MASEDGSSVELYIYDLSHGLASLLSPAILGQQIEGIWHTSVVVYGHEYFFGADGINSCTPGSTALGAPHRAERLGETFLPFPVFLDYVQGLAADRFSGSAYNLLEHNCNNFSDELAQFLCGARVPKHILELPARALSPALGGALQAALAGLAPERAQPVYASGVRHSRRDSPDLLSLSDQVEQARAQGAALDARRSTLADKLARRERRRERRRLRRRADGGGDGDGDGDGADMADAAEQEAAVVAPGPSAGGSSRSSDFEERRREEELRRQKDPPLVFRDIDGAAEFEKLSEALAGTELGAAGSLQELRQYLVLGEGSWALGDDFLAWAGAVLAAGAGAAELLRCLAAAALREDVALLLHQDRREHALVNYAHGIDRLPPPQQRALATLWVNLCDNVSASEWLLYISEWGPERAPLSNIRVTTKVAVHCTLSEDEALRDAGTALMHNIAIKEVKTVCYCVEWSPSAVGGRRAEAERGLLQRLGAAASLRALLPRRARAATKVFDDVCVELAMALLQFVGGGAAAAREEHLYRATRALARLAAHSPDVPQLLHLLAVQPDNYRGASPRVDEQIDLIMTKVK